MNFQCSVSVTLCMYNVPCTDTAQSWMWVYIKDKYWLNPEQTESLTTNHNPKHNPNLYASRVPPPPRPPVIDEMIRGGQRLTKP